MTTNDGCRADVRKARAEAARVDPTAAAVRAAQAEATGSMEAAVLQGPNAYTPEGWHALCERTLRRLATDTAAPEGFVDGSDFIDSLAVPVAVEGVETVECRCFDHPALSPVEPETSEPEGGESR